MRKFIALSALTLTATTMTAQNITYPKAPKDGTVDTYFGVKVPDPYRPLEADRSQETMAWVEAENKVTNAYLAKIPFRAKLLKRLKEVADFEKVGTPFNKNGKWYVYMYIRTTDCKTRVFFTKWTSWEDSSTSFSTLTS